ncbi:MAG: alpha/beta fold hydrolase [Hyphomicrobiales bacterium]
MTEPLVLVPGLNCTARLWSDQIVALGGGRAMEVADHRGHNTVSALAAAILADAPPKFALAGLSMGGYVAFEILRGAPGRVTRLALLDTTARPDTEERTAARLAQIEMVRGGRFDEIPDLQYPMLVHEDRAGDVGLKAIVRQMAEETGAEAFIRQVTAIMGRPDSVPLLAAIKCPTLVLVGEGDRLTPLEDAMIMHRGIRGSRLAVIPEAGHLSTIERPDAVSAALVDWLA